MPKKLCILFDIYFTWFCRMVLKILVGETENSLLGGISSTLLQFQFPPKKKDSLLEHAKMKIVILFHRFKDLGRDGVCTRQPQYALRPGIRQVGQYRFLGERAE